MRRLLFSAALLVSACASPAAPNAATRALGPELMPLVASTATFRVWNGEDRRFDTEVTEDGRARLRVADVGVLAEVERRADGVYFSDEPGPGTLLLKFGAAPGSEWTSGTTRVRFEGWERLDLPGAVIDAAHVTESFGPESFVNRTSWWFAPGVGVVRVVVDRAGLEAREILRVTPAR